MAPNVDLIADEEIRRPLVGQLQNAGDPAARLAPTVEVAKNTELAFHVELDQRGDRAVVLAGSCWRGEQGEPECLGDCRAGTTTRERHGVTGRPDGVGYVDERIRVTAPAREGEQDPRDSASSILSCGALSGVRGSYRRSTLG